MREIGKRKRKEKEERGKRKEKEERGNRKRKEKEERERGKRKSEEKEERVRKKRSEEEREGALSLSLSLACYPFPLKFSISSHPGCQDATIKGTLSDGMDGWIYRGSGSARSSGGTHPSRSMSMSMSDGAKFLALIDKCFPKNVPIGATSKSPTSHAPT